MSTTRTRRREGGVLARRLCRNILAFLLVTAFALPATTHATTASINIISIVTDDQARWAVGAYGNSDVKTPNIDRLAREGALFTNAFVATPVCSPSRASFLTGRYGTELGITDFISGHEQRRGLGLPQNAVTWPEVLQAHGYRTALIGKWHLGAKSDFHPTRHGFDHFYGFLGGGNSPMDPTLEVNGRERKIKGSLPDLLIDEALRYIDQPTTQPFALLLHFRAPHLPYGPVPDEDSAPFKDLDPSIPDAPAIDAAKVKKWTRDYYASIHSVDRNVGRLLEHLDQSGLTSRTVVLFTSDHGYNIGHHTLNTKGNASWIAGGVGGPKRPNMFDNSIAVPLIVRWPEFVTPGTTIKQVVSNIDTFPTLLAIAGVDAAADVLQQRGRDLTPLLRGDDVEWSDIIFAQYDLHNGGLAYMRMIRTPEWKLVRHYIANGLDELYDLKNDPEETKNLFDSRKHRKIRNDLQWRLVEWQRSINDPVLPEAENRGQLRLDEN